MKRLLILLLLSCMLIFIGGCKARSDHDTQDESANTKAVISTETPEQINDVTESKYLALFRLDMTLEEVMTILEENDIEIINEIENTRDFNAWDWGNKYIWAEDVSLTFDKDLLLYAISFDNDEPAPKGIKVGDDTERLEKAYGQNYKLYGTEELVRLGYIDSEDENTEVYEFAIEDYYFQASATNHKIDSWRITKYKLSETMKKNKRYLNDQIGFEIEFPESWDDAKYEVVEDVDGIKVNYLPQNRDIEKARLFELYIYGTVEEWNEWWDNGGEEEGLPFSKVGICNGMVIVESGPTEAIYQGREEAAIDAREYDEMMKDLGKILDSFKPLSEQGTDRKMDPQADIPPLTDEIALQLRDEAIDVYFTVFNAGGNECASFDERLADEEFFQYYFCKDLNSREKISEYLEQIFTESLVQEMVESSVVEAQDGSLVYTIYEVGSLLNWDEAELAEVSVNEAERKEFVFRVPDVDEVMESITLRFFYEENKGWRLKDHPVEYL